MKSEGLYHISSKAGLLRQINLLEDQQAFVLDIIDHDERAEHAVRSALQVLLLRKTKLNLKLLLRFAYVAQVNHC
jgi:hypothetical protein